ncbi:low temperature requirement protein A [Nocardia sp. NPDC058666]|uniref:low temperature requirement protein A n=1 Tax=unclassified Nocardia TaxID=2637762 RepID=UPI0036487506
MGNPAGLVFAALGESIVALGVGLADEPITVALVAMVALGLRLAYVMWWAYFGFDDERGEHALAARPTTDRVRPALVALTYAVVIFDDMRILRGGQHSAYA